MTILAPPPTRLDAAEWRALEASHLARADALTAGHRARAARGEKHPVEDFLFTYYSYKPAVLRRWHPGAGVELADASDSPRAGWRWYRPGGAPGSLCVDGDGFRAEKALLVTGVEKILRSTAGRAGSFGCFGLHEWAMVYRQGEHRHPVSLRLGQGGTDAVVEAHDLRCTHFDAFRFFTAEAVPRNRETPTRESQPMLEQPGCLHAGMDLYKWAIKLGPLVPGDLLLDAFELARDIRVLDMEASPYDLAAHGYLPVRIETPEGKAEYVRRQRDFSTRGQALRARLVAALGA
ncbi:3-methyladenine DNA glycosylase [Microbacterium sp. 4R-513]|uniref:3-methyladenine DNA glycosylase n=1 Tax=Microbacterium sp. 4R-513 TaxID=2567934 RepID=UPI0013E1BFA9|nr:3-methyladenine DNA glycosylase [Microbacterium sp. 4R-513]QIG40577.1 3-methyladenine DNA glycosylase [Microbacterium sp. 4R-513]